MTVETLMAILRDFPPLSKVKLIGAGGLTIADLESVTDSRDGGPLLWGSNQQRADAERMAA